MRTTVTLDPDVLERLQVEARTREEPFRKTLNQVIRDGLTLAEQRREKAAEFRIRPREIGLKPGLSYDSVSQLLELGEGEQAR